MQKHWTQRPENRARVAANMKRAALLKNSPAARRQRIATLRKTLAAKRAAAASSNGSSSDAEPPPPSAWKQSRAKASINALAVIGARVRLAELEREREMLEIFLKTAGEK